MVQFSDSPGTTVDRFKAAICRPIQAKRKSAIKRSDNTMSDTLPEKKVLAVATNDCIFSSLAGTYVAANTDMSESGDQALQETMFECALFL